MTPRQAIAALDRAMDTMGETIKLQRLTGTPLRVFFEVELRARLVGFAPEDIIPGSSLQQGDSKVILSPTAIEKAQWPGGQTASRIPIKGDRIVAAGKVKTVESVEAVKIGDTLVRVELQVRG